MDIKYPSVRVRLTGTDGNAYAILGKVETALLRYGISKDACDEFITEATSGSYEELLATCARWVTVS